MNTSVYIFKTDIPTRREAAAVCQHMHRLDGVMRCTVDLEDCDKVLRVEAEGLDIVLIERSVQHLGYFIEELPD